MNTIWIKLFYISTSISKFEIIKTYFFSLAEIGPLAAQDKILDYGDLGNFSLSGFEMILTRYVSTYIITYYLPSGTA